MLTVILTRGRSGFFDRIFNIYQKHHDSVVKWISNISWKRRARYANQQADDCFIYQSIFFFYFRENLNKSYDKTWFFSPLDIKFLFCLNSRGINDWHVFLAALIFYLKYYISRARLYLKNKINTKGAYIRHHIIRLIYHFSSAEREIMSFWLKSCSKKARMIIIL